MKQIKIFSKNLSRGVQLEVDALKSMADEHMDILEECTSLEKYITYSNAPIQYQFALERLLDKNAKILDIGVGRGESSLYLAGLGFNVFAVEPSADFCSLIEKACNKYKVNVTICQGVAEDLEMIEERDFDLIFFNASLHHCDDPSLALLGAYKLLKPDGLIMLSNELHIKPWVSKKRFQFMLDNYPEKIGHYGGNEHAYYSWEYIGALKNSGFKKIQIFPINEKLNPKEKLEKLLNSRRVDKALYSNFELITRFLYYRAVVYVNKYQFLHKLMVQTSLIPGNYIGRK